MLVFAGFFKLKYLVDMGQYIEVQTGDLNRCPSVLRGEIKNIDLKIWNKLGLGLWEKFPDDPERATRIHTYYLPLFFWLLKTLSKYTRDQRPLIIGINGPQGCGKSVLSATFVDLLQRVGLNGVAMSIDDFYLTRDEQVALASKYASNSLLQQRGYPGTHDIELGMRTFRALKNIAATGTVPVPVYDKSKNDGSGDRSPPSHWKKVSGPLDLIFLEGWMLGYSEIPKERIPNEDFLQINQMLKKYHAWYRLLDAFVHLMPQQIEYVMDWRVEAEERMKAQGRSGMSQAEVIAYTRKFIPAYEAYLPRLLVQPPTKENYLRLTLQKNRLPDLT